MIMRNTVFCAIPAEAAEPGPIQDAVTASVHEMAERVRGLRPRLHAARRTAVRPGPTARWHGMARVAYSSRSAAAATTCPTTPATWTSSPPRPPRWASCSPAAEPGTEGARPERERVMTRRAAASVRHRRRLTAPRARRRRRAVRLTDSTLRDGSHAMAHQFTEEQVRGVVHALDTSGVEVIEVSHGDGLGGSSRSTTGSPPRRVRPDRRRGGARRGRAKIAVLLLPGVGTIDRPASTRMR